MRRSTGGALAHTLARIPRALLFGLVALGATLPGTATAAPPDHQTLEVNTTFVAGGLSDLCGFTVEVTVVGTVHVTTFVDEAGNPVRVLEHGKLAVTFTNPDSGKSFESKQAQLTKTTFDDDGSVTRATSGLNGRLIVPGEGRVSANVGRIVVRFPAGGGPPEVIFDFGNNDDTFPCSALA